MDKKLEKETQRGKKAARLLVEHAMRMDCHQATFRVGIANTTEHWMVLVVRPEAFIKDIWCRIVETPLRAESLTIPGADSPGGKRCVECGKVGVGSSDREKYCSARCRETHKKRIYRKGRQIGASKAMLAMAKNVAELEADNRRQGKLAAEGKAR